MALKLRPLSDKIVVLPDDETKLSAGGLHLPHRANERPQVGRVIAVGPGKYNVAAPNQREDMPFEEGQRVFFGRYSGTELEIESPHRVVYIVLSALDVLAILDDDDDEAPTS